MWPDEVTLLTEKIIKDNIGNEIKEFEENTVFCEVKSVSRTEFYNAAQKGIKPSKLFLLNNFEYENQENIKYQNEIYKVIKTYLIDIDTIELTCGKVIE